MKTKAGILGLLMLGHGALCAAGEDNEGIAIWGHSYPADITPERLAAGLREVGAARPERPIVNQSIGGHGLDQSLMRQGAHEVTVEVEGGTIPPSGRVKLIHPRSPAMAKQFDAGLGPRHREADR